MVHVVALRRVVIAVHVAIRIHDDGHAWYWTDCIERLGAKPLKLDVAYQDQYLVAAGMSSKPITIRQGTIPSSRSAM